MEQKRCSRCGNDKDLDEFNVLRRYGREERQAYCRLCQADYYAASPTQREQIRRRSAELQAEMRSWLDAYKLERGCSRCHYNRCAAALDAHHLDESAKEFAIADAIRRKLSRRRIEDELQKCIILCSNCHRELHASVTQIG